MNRLARERSPYLLQHASNPVDWFPWGAEAFERARREQRPIFLSIGYSTCHWCHVMEHESFEDAGVAAVLNEHFVSIKVDREERPDVDRVYMSFVQVTTGSGGWPMSVWLTPELKPFYGGTYFPPSARWGRPGFVEILQEIARVWRADPAKVGDSAESITQRLREMAAGASRGPVPGVDALARTVAQFKQAFDPRYGGFGDAPKFPRPSDLLFLLREYARTGDTDARSIVLATLRGMARGGVRDHIGGGFHRYSVDAAWRVPHFEKMLYDQAQLVLAYVEGAQASGESHYLDVAEDTLRYVMREMTDASGGFYSAEDADSVPPEHAERTSAHKAEGAFYLWRADEIDGLFAMDDASLIKRRFGILPAGNAPVDPQQEFTGKNLLYVARSVEDLASDTGRPPAEVADVLGRARLEMFRVRVGRPHPYRDDKILTAWNGLMIAAFAKVARALRDSSPEGPGLAEPYVEAAQKAARFIRERLWNADSRTLLRRYRDGHAEIEGYADDYAYLVLGLVELFQADPDPGWLEWAVQLQRRQDELFWDAAEGGWFSTTGRDPDVLLRMKEDYDGAEPSASAVSVLNLQVLSHLVDEPQWPAQIVRTFEWCGSRLDQMGRAVPMMSAALSAATAGLQQIVIVGDSVAGPLAAAVAQQYLPFATILVLPSKAAQERVASVVPLIAGMQPADGAPVAYVCRDFACQPPVTTVPDLQEALRTS